MFTHKVSSSSKSLDEKGQKTIKIRGRTDSKVKVVYFTCLLTENTHGVRIRKKFKLLFQT